MKPYDSRVMKKHLLLTSPANEAILTKGMGTKVYDTQDNGYLDFEAGMWANSLGHAHPIFTSMLQKQLADLVHTGSGFLSEVVCQASDQLASILPPGDGRVIFLTSGSEAVECALKIIQSVTRGKKTLSCRRGYYGATSLAHQLSHSADPDQQCFCLPAPLCFECDFSRCQSGDGLNGCDGRCIDHFFETAKEKLQCYASVLFEPIFTSGGILIPPQSYFDRLKSYADKYNWYFIADEVTTGIGRTGRWLASEHYELRPDILVLGKGLGGGVPVSAVVLSDRLARQLQDSFRYIQSHQFDPLGACAALNVIQIIQTEGLLENCRKQGDYLMEALRLLPGRFPFIREIRGKGLLIGIEFQSGRSGDSLALAQKVKARLLERRIIVGVCPQAAVLRFLPPLMVPKEDCDELIYALNAVLENI